MLWCARTILTREVDVEVGVETPTTVEIVTGLDEGEQALLIFRRKYLHPASIGMRKRDY